MWYVPVVVVVTIKKDIKMSVRVIRKSLLSVVTVTFPAEKNINALDLC